MELENVLEQPGVKILDAGVFIPDDVFGFLQRNKNLEHFKIESLEHILGRIKYRFDVLQNNRFFTIEEVIKESSRGNENLENEIRIWGKQFREFKNEEKKKAQKIKNLIEEIKFYKSAMRDFSESRVIELSPVKKMEYEKLSEQIINLCVKYGLKIPNKNNFERDSNRNRNDLLHTDEKVIAMSFALAEKSNVLIITSDMDLARILYFIKIRGNIKYIERSVKIGLYYDGGTNNYNTIENLIGRDKEVLFREN